VLAAKVFLFLAKIVLGGSNSIHNYNYIDQFLSSAPKPADTDPSPDKFLISPLTGEQIPAHKIQEHMRIGLLDPSWHEKRDRSMPAKRDEEVYAPGASIGSSLRQLAERRTDIFGVGVEETQIGKKVSQQWCFRTF
jgi:splicing factor 3A subunit 1